MNEKKHTGELVVPVKIEIDATRKPFFDFTKVLEQKNSGVIIPNPARFHAETNDVVCTDVVLMNDELYEKILSVDSAADAETIAELCNENGLIFSFFSESFPFYDDSEVGITVDQNYYSKLILRDIMQFKTTLTIYNAINDALANPESYDLVVHAFDIGEKKKMGIAYDKNDPETANNKIVVAFCNNINQFVAISEFDIEDYQDDWYMQTHTRIDREAALEDLINGDGKILYTTIKDYAGNFTSQFINKHIEGITPRQKTGEEGLSLLCPTVLSAMYQMLFLSRFNNIQYRKCANPKCNRFFRVASHHPQKRCEQHMQALRRKRANQEEKKRKEIFKR